MSEGLSLNDAQREQLAGQGVVQDPDGSFHSGSGRPVEAGVAATMLAKAGITPGQFHRGYIAPGHQAEHAAGIGGIPQVDRSGSAPAEPGDFVRGWLSADHQRPDPGDSVNNPVPPGSDGAGLYASASGAYNSNRAKSIANHVAMTGEDAARPAVPQWRPRADLGAANLPTPMTIAASAMAPGERR
jgi:hypothetical protein